MAVTNTLAYKEPTGLVNLVEMTQQNFIYFSDVNAEPASKLTQFIYDQSCHLFTQTTYLRYGVTYTL
jgi:hypothetical protein